MLVAHLVGSTRYRDQRSRLVDVVGRRCAPEIAWVLLEQAWWLEKLRRRL